MAFASQQELRLHLDHKLLSRFAEADMMLQMNSLKSIFEKLIQPHRGTFSSDHADYVLSLHFSKQQHARYDALSKKASVGKLSVSERAELDDMLAANAILGILQSKARISLRKRIAAA